MVENTSEIRWGIIGCGDVALRKSGPALAQTPGSRVHAVMSRDLRKAQEFANKFDASAAYDSLEALLADSSVDAVYVATPVFLHAEQTVAAAEAGKHVLCEKPMGLSVDECHKMIDACRQNGVALSIAYYRRAYPEIQRMKQVLEEGEIGAVIAARVINFSRSGPKPGHWRLDPHQSGGGILMDVGSHRLDLLDFLLGEIAEIAGLTSTRTRSVAVDEAVSFTARFTSGALAAGQLAWNCPERQDWIEIQGSDGSLRADPLGSGKLEIMSAGKERAENFAPLPYPHSGLVENVVSVLQGKEELLCDGEAGLRTNLMMERIYQTDGHSY